MISCPYAPDYTGLGGIKGLEISYRFYQNLTNVIIEINSHSKLESNQSFLIPLLLTNILMRCFSRNEEEFLLFWNDFHKYNLNKIERLEKYSTSGLSKSFLKNPLYHEYTSKLNKELLNTPNTKPFENILKQWEVNCKQIFTDLGKLYNSSELIGLSGNKDLPRLSHIRNLFANKILELFGLSPVQ